MENTLGREWFWRRFGHMWEEEFLELAGWALQQISSRIAYGGRIFINLLCCQRNLLIGFERNVFVVEKSFKLVNRKE